MSIQDKAKSKIEKEGETKKINSSSVLELAFGGLSIYAIYLLYGVLQEKIFKANFQTDPEGEPIKFKYASVLIAFQTLLGYGIAKLICKLYYDNDITYYQIQNNDSLKLGIFNSATMLLSNTALTLISYPVQALMKSSKVLSIILVGTLAGRKYRIQKYICALLVTIGILIFNMQNAKKKGTGESSIFGILLCVSSLITDGLLADQQKGVQEKCKETQKKLSHYSLMRDTNKYCSIILFCYSIVSLQIYNCILFVYSHPEILLYIGLFSICGVAGQLAIYYTIGKSDPFFIGLITTTRKFFTIILSIIVFNHNLNQIQMLCLGIVFIGLGFEFYDSHMEKKKNPVQNIKKD